MARRTRRVKKWTGEDVIGVGWSGRMEKRTCEDVMGVGWSGRMEKRTCEDVMGVGLWESLTEDVMIGYRVVWEVEVRI